MENDSEAASRPIGIFDSGIGGLTVTHAIVKQLPNENIIYFGDTAHLPYGDKSAASIQGYSSKIAETLLSRQCKLILIACNSASAAAYEQVKNQIGQQAIVMNVIDPVLSFIKENYSNKHIGLIGTRQTVLSQIYQQKISALNSNIMLSSVATNLLASAIEEFGDHHIMDALLSVYLSQPDLQAADALLLACTHYPIIKNRITQHYKKPIDIIDSSYIVANAVKQQLADMALLNNHNTGSSQHFYVSDYTDSFAKNAKLFFGEDIRLEHLPLWEA